MNTITPEIETEAALYAEGTKYTKADILKAYRQHPEEIDIQRFCEEVLGISELTPESILPSLTGLNLRSREVTAALDTVDFTGYYPVIDGDLNLTGQFVYADDGSKTWSNYEGDAAIYNDVARKAGWTIEDGLAYPEPITLPATTLCEISGLSLEEWGLDEGCTVSVYPDGINATNESGLSIRDIAAGDSDLGSRVWAAAVKWQNGGGR